MSIDRRHNTTLSDVMAAQQDYINSMTVSIIYDPVNKISPCLVPHIDCCLLHLQCSANSYVILLSSARAAFKHHADPTGLMSHAALKGVIHLS